MEESPADRGKEGSPVLSVGRALREGAGAAAGLLCSEPAELSAAAFNVLSGVGGKTSLCERGWGQGPEDWRREQTV